MQRTLEIVDQCIEAFSCRLISSAASLARLFSASILPFNFDCELVQFQFNSPSAEACICVESLQLQVFCLTVVDLFDAVVESFVPRVFSR